MFFAVKRYICNEQHGFFPGRSTTTNCAVFTHFCISVFEKHNQVDAVFLDFCKAFDKVAHSILCLKLEKMGFHGTFLNWLRSYLSQRKYRVVVENFASFPYISTSGVPQGSVLGPLLFVLFFSDIGHFIQGSEFLLFADDLKIFREIHTEADAFTLQNCLTGISTWCFMNNLSLNLNKCYQMTLCKPYIHNRIHFQYELLSENLKTVDRILDLGIVLDTELNFNAHLDYIIPKAYSMCSFIRRNCRYFSDPMTLRLLYITFVRSKLEYCSFVWNPHYSVHSNRIEMVQKKFVKYALRGNRELLMYSSYYARCLLLGLKPLYLRRTCHSVMLIFKLINGIMDCDYLFKLIRFYVPFRTLRSNNIFYLSTHATNYATNEPMLRALSTLNKMNIVVNVDFSWSLETFKLYLENKDLINIFVS